MDLPGAKGALQEAVEKLHEEGGVDGIQGGLLQEWQVVCDDNHVMAAPGQRHNCSYRIPVVATTRRKK